MRTSLLTRAARAPAAALLILLLGPQAATFAHPQAAFRPPIMRPGFRLVHAQAQGLRGRGSQSWTWRGQNGSNRFGGNGWFWNQGGLYGGGFWYSPYGFADAGAGGGGSVIVVGAPSFSVFPGAVSESADPRPEGGCVIHKLDYDGSGRYVGERQTSEC